MLVFLARDGELTIANAAPMYLCDWAAVATVITLFYPNQWTYELGYFWALAGTLQALLTPDLSYEFPDPRFISFFALHGGVIASALYMTLGIGMRPVPMSILRALAWSAVYLDVGGLERKAEFASDVLGENAAAPLRLSCRQTSSCPLQRHLMRVAEGEIGDARLEPLILKTKAPR